MASNGIRRIVALDIDGTMGDYHGHFLRFAEGWYGRTMPNPRSNTQGVPLYKWMSTSKGTYRECKLAYRQGGLKRSMPCYHGMSELTHKIRRAGMEVWICTTRPYLRLDNIDPDTRHWLRRNLIQYDAVIYGQNKYRDLVKNVGKERIVCVVDDLPELITQAAALDLGTIMMDQPYNESFPDEGLYFRAYDAKDIWRFIQEFL